MRRRNSSFQFKNLNRQHQSAKTSRSVQSRWPHDGNSALDWTQSPRRGGSRRLGPRQITVDCDVLQADGGTRTASITGGMIALIAAINSIKKELPDANVYPLRDTIAAISVGIVDGVPVSDLDYPMDFAASVDMNMVMTGKGQFVEIQGTGEEATFSESELTELIKLGKKGIKELVEIQKKTVGRKWPF